MKTSVCPLGEFDIAFKPRRRQPSDTSGEYTVHEGNGEVKNDWRINLNTATKEDLMFISLEGPAEEDAAAAAWVGSAVTIVPQWEESQAAQHKTLRDKAAGQTSNCSDDRRLIANVLLPLVLICCTTFRQQEVTSSRAQPGLKP
ncbi:hypothetical protein EYF80_031136 [Liparis tanakae]|uniref:Uncharacterized protein n=1 Tax=Liparis tanakae TaxID=230148 RepID=A0A4Z2H0N4_9TELE|nr:hypothetical protein EYF80_031136 [Liparis tanakae]